MHKEIEHAAGIISSFADKTKDEFFCIMRDGDDVEFHTANVSVGRLVEDTTYFLFVPNQVDQITAEGLLTGIISYTLARYRQRFRMSDKLRNSLIDFINAAQKVKIER